MSIKTMQDQMVRWSNIVKNAFTVGNLENDTVLTSIDNNILSFPMSGTTVIVDNDTDLANAKNQLESFRSVFYSWNRFSRGNWQMFPPNAENTLSDSFIPSELNSFSYNEESNTISSSVDSLSLVGFYSPLKYTDYTFEVQIKSTSDWQNDPIGIVIGVGRGSDGKNHTLTVMRDLFGWHVNSAFSVDIDYNVATRKNLIYNNKGLVWANGNPATGLAPGGGGPWPGSTPYEAGIEPNTGQGAPWAISPWSKNPNGIMLKVQRTGNVFTIDTSNYNSTTYVPEARIVLDITDIPEARPFLGRSNYGYCAISQDYTVWDVKTRAGLMQSVVDARTMTIWDYSGSAWSSKDYTLDMYKFMPNSMNYSEITNSTYFYNTANRLVRI